MRSVSGGGLFAQMAIRCPVTFSWEAGRGRARFHGTKVQWDRSATMRRDVAICWRARGVSAPQRSERKRMLPATAEEEEEDARARGTADARNLRPRASNVSARQVGGACERRERQPPPCQRHECVPRDPSACPARSVRPRMAEACRWQCLQAPRIAPKRKSRRTRQSICDPGIKTRESICGVAQVWKQDRMDPCEEGEKEHTRMGGRGGMSGCVLQVCELREGGGEVERERASVRSWGKHANHQFQIEAWDQ